MIRFMIKHQYKAACTPDYFPIVETFSSIDADVPELEFMLRAGGYGNDGLSLATVIGIEVMEGKQKGETE